MTDVEKPRYSDDPRGGVYIDDGSTITRVEDEAPAAVEVPTPEATPAAIPEVANDV